METMRETVQLALQDVITANDLNIIDFEDFTDLVLEDMWKAFDDRLQLVIIEKHMEQA